MKTQEVIENALARFEAKANVAELTPEEEATSRAFRWVLELEKDVPLPVALED